jgi:hypothetical protein
MLTGDNENTKAVADELHLTSFIVVSEDKLKEIKDYKTKVKLWRETELMMLSSSRYRYCDGNRNRCSNKRQNNFG